MKIEKLCQLVNHSLTGTAIVYFVINSPSDFRQFKKKMTEAYGIPGLAYNGCDLSASWYWESSRNTYIIYLTDEVQITYCGILGIEFSRVVDN